MQRVLHTASSRTFDRSINPTFAAKLDDIVGRYVASPKHTVVLTVNENSRILASHPPNPHLVVHLYPTYQIMPPSATFSAAC